MLRDLAPGGQPDLVVAGDVRQRFFERSHAVGLTDQIRVQWNTHHGARFFALGVQAVELALEDVGITPRRDQIDVVDDDVVHLQRIRHAGQPALFDLDRAGLVVVEQVADIGQAHLGDQVQRVVGIGQRRRQPAIELLAGVFADGVDRVLDHRALLRLGHAHQVTRVVGAVRVELPAVVGAGLDDLGVVFANRHVQRHAAAHVAALHGLEHAPEAGAVAVVAVGIVQHIGRRTRPGRARRIARRVELVELDVRRHPERDPGAIGQRIFGRSS